VACKLRQQQLQQGDHLTKRCRLWCPTWQDQAGWCPEYGWSAQTLVKALDQPSKSNHGDVSPHRQA